MAYASDSDRLRIIGLRDEFDIGAEWAYQIQATAPDPSRVTKVEMQQMLQVLMSRFNLKVHRETREVDGFHLMVAKGGIKFKETSLEEEPAGLRGPESPTLEPLLQLMSKGRFGMRQFAAGPVASLLEGRPVL
jgi:uncharacterized protein (TIGR03435 family)